jgi:hypothetical protein
MSTARAIAAVTAVLKSLLHDGLSGLDILPIGDPEVTAWSPDRIPSTNADEQSQVNVFLYHVTPNSGWRNVGLPSRDSIGERLTNPPLALDLHYMITAYEKDELHAEVLLGYAMQILHETPVLTRALIKQTLDLSGPDAESLLKKKLFTSGLHEQVEMIKICPQALTTEEMYKIWTALQARYRPTAAYQISVVLIQETKPVRSALPVLTRGPEDQGPRAQADLIPPFPTLERIDLPKNQTSATMTDQVTLIGHHLAGEQGDPAQVTLIVQLISQHLHEPILIEVVPEQRTDAFVTFTIPHQAGIHFPSGFYRVSVQVVRKDEPDQARDSNELALLIAPRILAINEHDLPVPPEDPISVQHTDEGIFELKIRCEPEVLLSQSALLIVGNREITANPPEIPPQNPEDEWTNTLIFDLNEIAAGTYRLRLRVDGVDSLLIDRSDPSKLKFDDSQRVTLT